MPLRRTLLRTIVVPLLRYKRKFGQKEQRGVNILCNEPGMEPPSTFFTRISTIFALRQRSCGPQTVSACKYR